MRGESLCAELGVELAELLVGPEEEGGVPDALALHLQDEDVVLLGAVPLLDVLQRHLVQPPVRRQPVTTWSQVLLANWDHHEMISCGKITSRT